MVSVVGKQSYQLPEAKAVPDRVGFGKKTSEGEKKSRSCGGSRGGEKEVANLVEAKEPVPLICPSLEPASVRTRGILLEV